MRVSKVLDPASNAVSYTVVGVNGVVEPAGRHLWYLTETERSPNTIKAHAHDLKDWFVFLDELVLDWQVVKLDDVGSVKRGNVVVSINQTTNRDLVLGRPFSWVPPET